jgi:ribosomal protein S18 acetylase RimI-like enzyme
MDLQNTLWLNNRQLKRTGFNQTERNQLIEAMAQLMRQSRPEDWLEDNPNRLDLQELLALEEVCMATHLWRDEKENLVAFAFLDPFDNLIFECTNSCEFETLFLAEAEDAAQTMREKFKGNQDHPTLDGSSRDTDIRRIRAFERAGFIRSAFESVFLLFVLKQKLEEAVLPEGFRIRPMKGSNELDDYITLHRAAFGTENMTRAFRESIMATDTYNPDLDLVMETPEGQLAGFCVCQIGEAECEGWTDPIGVHPDFQGKGLGKAILLYGLKKLKERGIKLAKLGTRSDNYAMLALAKSAGFREDYRRVWFSKGLY